MTQLFPGEISLNMRTFLVAAILFSSRIFSQTTIVADSPFVKGTTVVISGEKFKKSAYHNVFWGKHYRKEWTTPVRVSNFYIDTAMGGLTPIAEGGSRQSRGLRLKSGTGKEYVLRSVDKDFGRAFSDSFLGTFITRVAKDQASIAYPFAAITITPMMAGTGIYHTNPKIVFVPKQGPLGDDYNKKYGDQLYLFEERPDENQADADYFGNSKNVIGSERLFEHIYEDNDNRVDQKAFARARLFDMVIGDWGRHPDNWRWAKFEEGKTNIYRPIPRDRDQAYTKFDGLWPWFATNVAGATHLESFNYKMKNVKKFNKPGWPLDRTFLNELTEEDWINVAKELQASLTDQVIEAGINQLPPELFHISGEKLIAKLKSRRDHLQDYARRYYNFLSHHVELTGSNEREFFDITRINNNQTQINIHKITKENEIKKEPYYSRTFFNSQTREIRLYSLDNSDIIKVTGPPHGVKVRVVDPAGTDSITVDSKGRTKVSVGKRFLFDTLHTKKFDFFIRLLLSAPEYRIFEDDPMGLFTKTGARVSINARYLSQPWRTAKYMHTHLFSANYGFLRNAVNLGYVGRFSHAVGPFDLLLKARWDPQAVENYYGPGNETANFHSTRNYHKTYTNRIYAGIGLSLRIDLLQELNFSGFYQNIKVDQTTGHYVSLDHTVDPALFEWRPFAGIEAAYHFHKTNNSIFPTAGVDFMLAADYVHNLQITDRSFTNVASTLSVYVPLGKYFSIASRAGGAALSGNADFYHLNMIGGSVNLRGYERERFSGKTTFYNNNELRWVTNTKSYLFNGKIGLLGFYDVGRVWQPLEKSDIWHDGYGAGLILIPFNRIVMSGTYATSVEGNFIQFKATMFF
jgi:surface antigen Omp85-like protein